MEKKGSKKSGILLTLLGGICWGISGCFGQYLFQQKEVTSNWLVSVRLVVAGILLLGIGWWRVGKELNCFFHDRRDLRKILVFSVFGMLFCQYFYFSAVEFSNAGTATVLQSLAPFVILTIVCIRSLRLPKGREVIAVFAAVSGVFLLSTHGDIHNMMLTEQALFFGLASAAGAAAYNLLSAEMLRKYGVYSVVGYGMLFGGIVLTVIVRPWRYELIWDMGTVIALFGVIVIGTAIAFSLYLKGVSMVGPFMGSLLGMVEPVTAIVVSFLFLDTEFQWIDLVGFALILGTVLLMSLGSSARGSGQENKA